jgi:hypothetical protein
MPYSSFDLRTVLQNFSLTEERDTDLFAAVGALEPSEFLRPWLDELAPVAVGVNSEKARSEYIITPLLVEARRRAGGTVTVLPGVTFDVDQAQGLTGFCDYLVSRSPEYYFVRGPVLAVVEAKREDLIGGLGQCAAEMVAIRIFNDQEGTPLEVVHGCVTSGSIWRFLKLQGNQLWIDHTEYHIRDAGKLLGILVSIMQG